MKPMIHVFLCDDDGQRFFGEGPYRLLTEVDASGPFVRLRSVWKWRIRKR